MEYDCNRRAFRQAFGLQGVDTFLSAYNGCILLELSLKQALGLTESPNNGGHDLLHLINQVARRSSKHTHACRAFNAQIVNASKKLICQGKNGTPAAMPPSSYPHIRYLRHSTDWTDNATQDEDIERFLALIQRIVNYLQSTVKIAV